MKNKEKFIWAESIYKEPSRVVFITEPELSKKQLQNLLHLFRVRTCHKSKGFGALFNKVNFTVEGEKDIKNYKLSEIITIDNVKFIFKNIKDIEDSDFKIIKSNKITIKKILNEWKKNDDIKDQAEKYLMDFYKLGLFGDGAIYLK